ncbi:hypothetical protein BJ993_001234 [Nocardioides aromaticivorans]|uniref:Zinc ribbon domain-containing protein n=1 Tax=Nocardioides aromaticivorans TaxID=200618 RepID=A0A7Y9ZEW4_9ACTN|nr:hypothetical protein [Nocardioides aromaticivorans]NYI44154.1 hypothetical protein [Nocardioides aromaticivorans]
MNFCTHCGAPRADLVQPCSRCGVAPAAPTQPVSFEKASEVTLPASPGAAPPPPPPAPQPFAPPPVVPLPAAPPPVGPPGGRRRGRSVLLVLLAAVLAVVVGVGTALLLAGGDDDPAAGGGERASDGAADATPTGAGAEDPVTQTAGEASYTCWDGRPAEDVADCGKPRGAEGLVWVFPDADGPRCSATMGNRGAEADCRVRASSGGQVRVHYSEWSDWDAAHAEYSAQDVQGAVTRWRDFFRWYISPRRGDWEYKVALLYRDAPWSVTVYGHSAADRDEVLRQLATRPVGDLMGERKK